MSIRPAASRGRVGASVEPGLAVATEQWLASQAVVGDRAAFTELVRRHERRVRSFLGRLCRGEGADDLAQETFVQAWRRSAAFRGDGSYEGWLLRIAWRLFLSERRTARPEVSLGADQLEQWNGAAEGTAIDVERALGTLSATERAAALLCYAHGYSHSEAAAILDLPLGTLKSTVARARARLATCLKGYEP